MKVSIVCHAVGQSFVPPLQLSLAAAGHESRVFDENEIGAALEWGEAIWCEWARSPAAGTATLNAAGPRLPIVVRVHRYEVYQPEIADFPWRLFGAVAAPNEHFAHKVRMLGVRDPVVVPYGVDLEKFAFQEHAPGKRFGYVGNIIPRKNILGAAQALSLVPDAELHVAGAWGADADYRETVESVLPFLAKTTFCGPVADVAEWWKSKDYYISASWHESGPYSLYEAAACGVHPLVFHAAGIACPADFQWIGVDEVAFRVTRAYRGREARAWVEREHDARRLGGEYGAAIEKARAR